MKNYLVLAVILVIITRSECISPNIVLILTDDQDLALNSLSFLSKINKLLINKGAIFANAVSSHHNYTQNLYNNSHFISVHIITSMLSIKSFNLDRFLCSQHGNI